MKSSDVNEKQNALWICIVIGLCSSGTVWPTIIVDGFTTIDEASEFAHYYQKNSAVKRITFQPQPKNTNVFLDERIVFMDVKQFKQDW